MACRPLSQPEAAETAPHLAQAPAPDVDVSPLLNRRGISSP
jgi:hypothetical protein